MLGAQPGPFQIDREDTLPFRFRHRRGVEIGVDARVVHQDIESAELLPRCGDGPLDIRLASDIAAHEEDARVGAAERRLHSLSALLVDVEQGDTSPFVVELLDDSAANALRAAGDHGNLVLQSHTRAP